MMDLYYSDRVMDGNLTQLERIIYDFIFWCAVKNSDLNVIIPDEALLSNCNKKLGYASMGEVRIAIRNLHHMDLVKECCLREGKGSNYMRHLIVVDPRNPEEKVWDSHILGHDMVYEV